MYAGRRQEIEDKMHAELSGTYLTERERLVIQMCSVVATREVEEALRKERAEFRRDLERIRGQVDEAQELGQAVSRALQY